MGCRHVQQARGNAHIHQGRDVIAFTKDLRQSLEPGHADLAPSGRWLRVAGKCIDHIAQFTQNAGDHGRLLPERIVTPRRAALEGGRLLFGAKRCEAGDLFGGDQS